MFALFLVNLARPSFAADLQNSTFYLNPGDSLKIESKSKRPKLSAKKVRQIRLSDSTLPGQGVVVQHIYKEVPADINLASSDVIYTNDLAKAPVTSVKNAIAGRLTGIYTNMYSNILGTVPDGVSTFLRGQQDPLIIVDGVVTPVLTTMNFQEIESITVLKDALATAVLGVRGSRGALVITTKKGSNKKNEISFTAQTAIQSSMGLPKILNAYDYAKLYNEAIDNDNLTIPKFSQDALNAYKDHTDPYNYPDINWRNQITNNTSTFSRYSVNTSGGNEFARYFVAFEHGNQQGIFKTADSNNYNTNNFLKTYQVRSNVDVDITSKLKAGINLFGRIMNANEPGSTTATILNNLLNTPNNAYPVFNRDGSYGGTQQFQNNIWAQTIGSGYRSNYKRDMLVNMYLKRTLDELTKGLWIQVKAAYNASFSENYNRSKSFAVFQANTAGSYTQYGTNGTQSNSNGIAYQERRDYEEFSVGYDRSFSRSGISAMVLANRDNSVGRDNDGRADGSDLPYTISGGSAMVNYSFDKKYILETALGYNGSNRYPNNGFMKMGFFPAVGLGWNMEHENFMKDISWLNKLKLFATYGKTGWDQPGYFSYIQRFYDGPYPYFGTGAGSVVGITEQPLANANLDFEKAKKLNVGFETLVAKEQLLFRLEYYNDFYYDLLRQRGRNSALLGNSYPDENIGKYRYTGIETRLTWNQKIKQFGYYATINASTQNSKVVYIDEVFRQYDWMKRTGHSVGQNFGYVADGLYQSQAEINGSATIDGYTPMPGDIRYKDLNKDGVINQFDVAPIGLVDKPLIYYGLDLGFNLKGLDFSIFFQGVKNRNIYLSGSDYWAFQNGGSGQAYEHNLGRWTANNGATATYPRVNIGVNNNNQAGSSYWMRNGDYYRLKSMEVGYSIPPGILSHIHLNTIRLFVNGFNLFTHSDKSIDGRDPEVFEPSNYPIQRSINFGINVKF